MSSQRDLFHLLLENNQIPTIERWFRHNVLEPYNSSSAHIFERAVQDHRHTLLFAIEGHLDSMLQCTVQRGWLLSFRRLLRSTEPDRRCHGSRQNTTNWTPSQQLIMACLKKGSRGSHTFFLRLLARMFRSPSAFSKVPVNLAVSRFACPSRKELEDFCWFAISFWKNATSVLRLLRAIESEHARRKETGPFPWCTFRSEPYGETALHLFFRRKTKLSSGGVLVAAYQEAETKERQEGLMGTEMETEGTEVGTEGTEEMGKEREGEELLLQFLLETCLPDEQTAFRRSRSNHCFLSYAAFQKCWGPVGTVFDLLMNRKGWSVPVSSVLTCMLHAFPDRHAPGGLLNTLVLQLDLSSYSSNSLSDVLPSSSSVASSPNPLTSSSPSESSVSRDVRRVYLAILSSQNLDSESMRERLRLVSGVRSFVYPPNLMIMKACGSLEALRVARDVLLHCRGLASSSAEVEPFFQTLFGLLHVCRKRQEFRGNTLLAGQRGGTEKKENRQTPPFPPVRTLAFGGRGRKLDFKFHGTHIFQRTKVLFFLDLLLFCYHRLVVRNSEPNELPFFFGQSVVVYSDGDPSSRFVSRSVDLSNFCYAPLSMCSGRLTVLDHCFELDDRTLIHEVLLRGGRFSKEKFSHICSMHQFVRDTVRDQVFSVLKKMVFHCMSRHVESDCLSVVFEYLRESELVSLEPLCTHGVPSRLFSRVPVLSRWTRDPLSLWVNSSST
jgi:hypothetical protein